MQSLSEWTEMNKKWTGLLMQLQLDAGGEAVI